MATKAKTDGAHKTVTATPELAAVIGSEAMPRTQVISKLWDYIRTNKLQDPADKRQIVADAKLKKVFGKDKVSMFEMNKYVSQHLK